MSEKKTAGELLKEKLLFQSKNGAETFSEEQMEAANRFCEGYKKFLDSAKTEREAVEATVALLKEKGYQKFELGKTYQPGEKIYCENRGKALLFATIGTEPLENGVRIMASHIDAPRLDLKPHPLYEDAEMGFFKTHYYGGIKKYHWPTTPLALHGVVCKKDGTSIKVRIGEEEGEPVFCITDLLPHLAGQQATKPLGKAFTGENLNILIGSYPFRDDKVSEKVKLNLANILFEKYGIVEEDLLSAELSMVPAQKAKDVGFDRSMVGAYAHDDRVCAYTSVMAALEVTAPQTTHITVLADKEEVGSDGNTGLNSSYLDYFVQDLAASCGVAGRTVLSRSQCLSADVNCAFDPNFPDVSEKNNNSKLNHGVVITKYTGAGGKYDTNDASAEFMGTVRKILDDAEVLWQTGELGKVDQGGGGTVAKYIASLNVDVVDLGVPVLSMHAPFEIVSKVDVYSTYQAFKAFVASKK